MPNEEEMTITQTAPDGTETVIEVTSTKPDDATADGDKTVVEEVYEALFDNDGDDDDDGDSDDDGTDDADTDADEDTDDDEDDDDDGDDDDNADDVDDNAGAPSMYELTPTDDELSTNTADFSIGRDSFPSVDIPPGTVDPAGVSDIPDAGLSTAEPDADTASDDPDAADQQAHADAAKDAQDAADQFVAQGDYKAAAEARETAEDEAYAAGDSSMLDGSNAGELTNAGDQQDNANYYRDQQAEDIKAGDYEAAKEDAQNVAYATGDADYNASGADHTEQADKDVGNLDWAVWDQKNADGDAQNAAAYAAEGDFDNAAVAAGHAESEQGAADGYADHADPASAGYDYAPSSDVASGGTYDAGAVDTGFDASADVAAAPAIDPGTDDV